jgi:Sulfotransferase family
MTAGHSPGEVAAGKDPVTSPATRAGTTRILYIGGWGRSGSTLLARMLAQVRGMVAVGEVRDIWLRGCLEDRLCGCGVRFYDCDFWSAVGDEAFGGWSEVDPSEMLRVRSVVDRPWTMPALLRPGLSSRLDRGAARYVDVLRRMYEAMSDVSGNGVIVDSSKIPSHGLLLTRIPHADVRVVHLVRDSRGVVFSWQKHVRKPDRPADADEMLRYGAVSASGRYVLYNLLTESLRRAGAPYLRLRYEDLVADPARALQRILRGVGVTRGDAALHFLTDDSVSLRPSHTVDGNPMRFERGPVRLRLDDEWRTNLGRRDRVLVSVLTAPVLARYGYLPDRSAA